jgi:acetoin utilization deacetylase AcuC-like enzyme
MSKYARLRERVAEHGLGELLVPEAASDADLLRAHDPGYVRSVAEGTLGERQIRRIGFPWSPGLVERSRRSVGGTIQAARAALSDGVGVNLAGGTHHAFRDRGEGFCVFNDVAVATRALQHDGSVRRVTILDLDVHQGNGTARIFRGDPDVFTLSVHGEKNFPFAKEESDLDVELPDGAGDPRFLDAVHHGVRLAIEASRPDLVFYVAGADPYEGDKLGRLAVSKAGLEARDEVVFSACDAQGIPVAVVMSGGYAEKIDDIVDIHFASVQRAARHAEAVKLRAEVA